jgi:hypothetical protein
MRCSNHRVLHIRDNSALPVFLFTGRRPRFSHWKMVLAIEIEIKQ